MHRVVHLDLKGAPWQVSYLIKVIPLFKTWGATGVLIEWEDTFPYTSDLIAIGTLGGSGRDGLYNRDEVKYILQLIKDHGLEPIQLVQSIGHMEYVLKHPMFRGLREVCRSPAVLCPSRPESRTLVNTMIRQLLEVQPDAAYLHIGGDEAWHMNVCSDCKAKSEASEHKVASLYLEHIKAIASYVKAARPDITVLIWDDMIRPIDAEVLKAYDFGDLVQPVVWNYSPAGAFHIDMHMWERYSRLFPKVWIGSAFKGANGSAQIMSSVPRYVSNQEAWSTEMNMNEGRIQFSGVILTGWSRYDHYATLCELLPVSLPSLASCLKAWTKPHSTPDDSVVADCLPIDMWPGHEVARCIQAFYLLRERCNAFLNGDQVTTWLNPWQLEHDYTCPIQVDGIAVTAKQFANELNCIKREISTNLHAATGRRSAEEWLQTFLAPIAKRMVELASVAEARSKAAPGIVPKSDKSRPCD